MRASVIPTRRRIAALVAIFALGCRPFDSGASAQPAAAEAPLFDCTLEHHLGLLEPDAPAQTGFVMNFNAGFVFDAASGIFRWRTRASGGLREPERWSLLQRGSGGNDWLAVKEQFGRPTVLRIRMWGAHPGRFVLFDDLGSALTGRCR